MPASKKTKQLKAKDSAVEVVHEPKASDILCGKDKSCVAHEGSVRFRKIIDQYRERYCDDSTSKQDRMKITKEIVNRLNKSSRFLKYDTKEKVWKTITALAARDKVSHALRFANLKENRRTGKVKNVRRRVSSSSDSSSDSNIKTSPEDTKLWNSLVTRQTKLLESIKKGEKGTIPAIVELDLPESITVTPESGDCDPLSINDSSFEQSSTFQDYCLQFYTLDNASTGGCARVPDDNTEASSTSKDSTTEAPTRHKYLYEEQSDCDDTGSKADIVSTACDSEDRCNEIASMITEPLMEWDLEHDGIFEV